jgi:transposase
MRFVPETIEQQSGLFLYRTRSLLIHQQTSVIKAIRGHLAEFEMVAPVGRNGLGTLLSLVATEDHTRLPEVVRASIEALALQLRALKAQILEFDRKIIQ